MLWVLVVTVFVVEAVIIAGWWTAEIGRQPWVVYDVLATADGGSPTLSGTDVAISLGMFIALYAILLALFLYLLNRAIQEGPEPLEVVETVDRATLPDTFRDVFSRRDRAGSSGEG
jgi:cytochrome d ubiquinol oxidase subunit I